MKVLIAIASLLMLSTPAQADWWYKEPPAFLTYSETEAKCRVLSLGSALPMCHIGPRGEPDRYNNLATDGHRTWVENETRNVPVQCLSGICSNVLTNEYLGRFSLDTGRFYLTRGHYVYEHSNGELWHYRMGTGPLAEEVAPYYVEAWHGNPMEAAVYEDPVPQEERSGLTKDLDLYCNPQNGDCYLEGEYLGVDELPNYLPMADIKEEFTNYHNCYDAICVDMDENFIGLNPFFFNW